MYMFADDATLFVSGHSVESVETQLNLAMSEIHLWTIENKLILNAKKTPKGNVTWLPATVEYLTGQRPKSQN